MSSRARRTVTFLAGFVLLAMLCFIFPRVLTFVELAAREIRYLWWLIAILALGVWFTFFLGRKID